MLILVLVLVIPGSSAANISPSSKTVNPGQWFDLNVSIDPLGTPIAGAQLDLAFNKSILRINSVTEGNLFKQKGDATFFNGGIINNAAGTVVNIFNAIIGKSNVTTPGTFIIINITAIGSGTSKINLSNAKISDPNGNPVALKVTNGSVIINTPASDTTPPASITALQNSSYAQNYITWNWIDPADTDFSKVMIYLDGSFKTNVTKGANYYNAAGLSPDASYTISTHTVDTPGNVNQTWVNHTTRTAPAPTPAAVYDNRLREGSPDTVLGGSSYMDIGHIQGIGRYRDVLRFNLSAYNSTDRITSATISLFWYYPSNARNNSTTVDIYRPLDWDPSYVNWNNRTPGTPWSSKGGDWFDKNNAAQGNVPFASITFNASTLPDYRYYEFNVTELVQSYVSGKYSNTGFFLKAKDEYDNYIAFYSSDWSNASQRPGLAINHTAAPAPVLTAITVSPMTASVLVSSTAAFTALPKDQFGSPINAAVTWSSSNTGAGTVNASTGMFTAIAPGTTTITASSGTVSGSAIVTVTAPTPVLTTITVSPVTASVVVGSAAAFTSTPRDQFGNPITAAVTWSSSNTSAGAVNASTGMFTAIAPGTTIITASSGAVSGSAIITVAA